MGRFLRIAAIVVGTGLLIGFASLGWVYHAAHRPVAWYEEALLVERPVAEAAGDELEKQALALVSEVKRPAGHWEMLLTDEQINGWLAVDLTENYADNLPERVSDPRVAIDPGGARFACRYETPQISTVLNLQTRIYLTQEPNVVAVRVCKARAGGLPLPLKQILDQATSLAQSRGIGIRWAEVDGDPMALLTLSSEYRGVPGRVLLETLTLQDGAAYVAGTTTPLEPAVPEANVNREPSDQPPE